MKIKHLILALSATALLLGCAKTADPVAEITLSQASAQLFAKGIDISSDAKDVEISFTSAKAWKVSVEETKALSTWLIVTPASGAAGEAKITISADANTSLSPRSAKVTLSSDAVSQSVIVTQAGRPEVKISAVTLNKDKESVKKKATVTLKATVTPSNADEDMTLTWASSDPSVASVDANGVVTGVKIGTANITAKAGNITSAPCVITVIGIDATDISLDKTSHTIYAGDEFTLVPTVTPADADYSIVWSSSNTDVATVAGGKVTGKAYGTAVISAKIGQLEATCTVTVDLKGTHGENLDDPIVVDPWK